MNIGRLVRIALGPALCLGLAAASDTQLPPAAKILPAGFKVVTELNQPNSVRVEATKPNVNFPKPHMDQGIRLEVSWSTSPMAGGLLEILAKQPEDPLGPVMGVTREEPAGKQRHRGGVLRWRKVIIPWVGSGKGPDLVTWKGSWVGAGFDGLLGVSISNFAGSKEEALSLLDGVINKITPPS